jgi:hypothetical protein
MKVFLMHPDRDFAPDQERPSLRREVIQDLELNTIFHSMAKGDKFLFEVAQAAMLNSLEEPEAIRYRQDVLRDCLAFPDVVRRLYRIPTQALENQRRRWLGIYSHHPSGVLSGGRQMLEMFCELLVELKHLADDSGARFQSPGFRTFFSMVQEELNDEYLASVRHHLARLRFRDGVLLSAELGQANEGTNYVLRKGGNGRSWIDRILGRRPPAYSLALHPRDDAGARALGELRDRGINLVANAVARAADHVDGFFKALRLELAFYIGCLNLAEHLARLGAPVCLPAPVPAPERRHTFAGLYDVALALTLGRGIVGNDVEADDKSLVVITGANQGGKSTFLRSIGLAQLMMQGGMFVGAETFCANACRGLFTHFRREEDSHMQRGKLDEELARMSQIVENLRPDCLVLFNESFAATNEREGSEIARQITSALLDRRVKVFYVTHLYAFAKGFHERPRVEALFLRAERKAGQDRTFRLRPGEPLPTAYGKDVYDEVFGSDGQKAEATDTAPGGRPGPIQTGP